MESQEPVTAIVLAAGRSRRMGAPNKLLLEIGGHPVVSRVITAFLTADVARVIVVTGADREAVAKAIPDAAQVHLAYNPDYAAGIGASIRCGVSASEATSSGLAICPGDLPLLTADTIRQVLRAFYERASPCIVRPRVDGQPGHPVLFGRAFRGALMQLRGDEGARDILRRHGRAVTHVDVEQPGAVRDVDTPQALRAVRAQWADTFPETGREGSA
jgi:molybdenum cofactor cytidylyltransferase